MTSNNLNGEVPTKGIFKNVTAVQIDGNKGLYGGAMELHLLACVMPSNSTRHKESLVLKVVIPIASIVSLVMVVFGLLL
jgi:hypothetical protein